MAGEKKYNNHSKKLLEFFTKPTQQEPLRFQLNGIRLDKITKKHITPQSSSVDPLDRIYDPWQLDEAGNEVGGYIDIAYISSMRPGNANSNRDTNIQLGEIVFHRASVGTIEWTGADRKDEERMKFLFFSNRNESNVGKPWHVPHRFGYIYKMISKTDEAKVQLTRDKLEDQAIAAISRFDKATMEKIKKGMFPAEYLNMSDAELEIKLRAVAKKTPEKILNMSTDGDVEMNAFITNCEQAGLIEFNAGRSMWQWGDTKEKMCLLKPGQKTKFVALKSFFLTDAGLEVVDILESQLAEGKPKKEKKEQPSEEPVKERTGAANLPESKKQVKEEKKPGPPKGDNGKFQKKEEAPAATEPVV